MACLADPAPSVRAGAVALIASLLAVVTLASDATDGRLRLPALTKLAADGEVAVRCPSPPTSTASRRPPPLPRNCAMDASGESKLRRRERRRPAVGGGAAHLQSFGAELATLQKLVSNLVEQLLTDAHAGQSA